MEQLKTDDKAISPMSQDCVDVSTQENIKKESCDVKLSPILFQQSAATSPIVSETKCTMVDTGSSPVQHPKSLFISAATSPIIDEKMVQSPAEQVSESLDFEMSMTDEEVSKTSEKETMPEPETKPE